MQDQRLGQKETRVDVGVHMEPAPDVVDLLAPPVAPLESPRPVEAPSVLSRVIYLVLAALPVFLFALVAMARAGIISRGPTQGKTPWDLGILILASIMVVAVSALVARRVPQLAARAAASESLDQDRAKWEMRLLFAALPPAWALLTVSFLVWQGIGAWRPGPMGPPLLSTAAVLLAVAPVAYFSYTRERHVHALESRFPDFLRDLNESYGAGLTMAQAIRVAARGDYGKLNPEIRRMANQVSWGTPFPEALRMFADRVGTPIVTRAVALIIKATRAGGNAKDVLAAAARDAREIKTLQEERRLSMTLYVLVIYVAFAVFLGVVAALQGLLVPALLQATQGVSAGGGIQGLSVAHDLNFTDFRLIYFGVGLVQAIGSGIVAGIMSEASFAAGLRHAAILAAMSFVVLGILL